MIELNTSDPFLTYTLASAGGNPLGSVASASLAVCGPIIPVGANFLGPKDAIWWDGRGSVVSAAGTKLINICCGPNANGLGNAIVNSLSAAVTANVMWAISFGMRNRGALNLQGITDYSKPGFQTVNTLTTIDFSVQNYFSINVSDTAAGAITLDHLYIQVQRGG
jgi:hypothetical protein